MTWRVGGGVPGLTMAGRAPVGPASVPPEAGTTDFLSVLGAERTSLDRADAVAVLRAAEARNLIAVYRAMAGGNSPAR